jgi:hypothetical protein
VNRRTYPPTLDQLLNLADRAEDGPLSPAEAARLREGLRLLAHPPRGPYRTRTGDARRVKQLTALNRAVRRARDRGAPSVPLYVLSHILDRTGKQEAA